MGEFYYRQIADLVKAPSRGRVSTFGGVRSDPGEEEEYAATYRQQLRLAQPRIFDLIIELLRYQKWPNGLAPNLAADGWRRR